MGTIRVFIKQKLVYMRHDVSDKGFTFQLAFVSDCDIISDAAPHKNEWELKATIKNKLYQDIAYPLSQEQTFVSISFYPQDIMQVIKIEKEEESPLNNRHGGGFLVEICIKKEGLLNLINESLVLVTPRRSGWVIQMAASAT